MNKYLLAFLCVAFSACSNNIVLDNPSSAPVTFKIDEGEAVEVPAQSQKEISLDAGRHHIQVSGQSVVERDTNIQVKEGGIIHCGFSNYLIFKQLYGLQKDRKTLLHERWVEFDSSKVFGDIRLFPAQELYIEKAWDHGLDEALPESQTLLISNDFKILSKVYRSVEFLQETQKTQGNSTP
jgi:hypothetical protein